VSTQTVQVREMSWFDNAGGGDYDYYDGWLGGDYPDDDDDDDDDGESIEADSARRAYIINGLYASSVEHLDLSDVLWTSSVMMESFQSDVENIIVALQSNRTLKTVDISCEVLAAIGESNQGRLFCSLGNLPTLRLMSLSGGAGSPTAIHMRVFADALSETSNGLKSLELSGFKISSRSEVEQLARGLKSRVESLETLVLVRTVLDAEDKTGFLDPILLALAPVFGEPHGPLSWFEFNCAEAASNGVNVVSPEALGVFFAEEPVVMRRRAFYLQNLGLNDDHCEVMAQELARDDALLRSINRFDLSEFDLSGNPSIGQQGYAALIGILNRRFDIEAVDVDDQNWQATFDLVIYMNCEYERGRFLRNGVFPSKAMLMNFLAELTNRWRSNEAKTLNAIWYTLRANPDLIYN
jgi:hypothetical protein